MFNDAGEDTTKSIRSPHKAPAEHLIELLEREGGFVSFAQLQSFSGFTHEEMVSGLRELYLAQRVEHIPGNGVGNSRYRLMVAHADTQASADKPAEGSPNRKVKTQREERAPENLLLGRAIAPAWANPLPAPVVASQVRLSKGKAAFNLSRRPGGFNFTMKIKDARVWAKAILHAQDSGLESPAKDLPDVLVLKTDKMTIVGQLFVIRLNGRPGGVSVMLSRYQAIMAAQRVMEMTPSH
jgi:hypothetical protein